MQKSARANNECGPSSKVLAKAYPPPMASLLPEQNGRVRALARRLLVEKYDSNESAFSRDLEVSQSLVSRFLSGKTGTSLATAQKIAALAGADVVSLLEIEPPSQRQSKGAPRLGDHPDWPEIERQVREGRGGERISEAAWQAARSTSGGPTLPRRLRPADVRQLAEMWQEAIEDAPGVPVAARPPSRPGPLTAAK